MPIKFGASNFIQANAGCGKTYALSGQYLALLLSGEDPANILASTFTRKAASEIQERVFLRLIEAINNPAALKTQLPDIEVSKNSVMAALNSLITNLNKIQISTLDSFQSSITRLFAEELQLPFGWRIIAANEYDRCIQDAISNLCTAIDAKQMWILIGLLKRGKNKRSISNTLYNALSFVFFVFNEVDLSDSKLWSWLKIEKPESWPQDQFINSLSLISLPKTKTGTVNKNFSNAVEKLSAQIKNADFDALLENGLLSSILQGNSTYSKAEIPADLAEICLKISNLATQFALAKLTQANQVAYTLTNALTAELDLLENNSGLLTFDRITKKLLKLSKSLYTDEFYFRLDSRIKHLLLDEFQDTSLAQWLLLKPLIEEKLSDCSESQTCFCVGDGKQSIYAWRGARAEIFDLIPDNWPDLNLGQLDTSYRSAQHIISFVNSLFPALKQLTGIDHLQDAADIWLKKFQLHKTVKLDYQSEVYFESINSEFEADSYLTNIFERIFEWLKLNPTASVAILARENKELGLIAEYCKRKNIAVAAEGGKKLEDFSVISCILAVLKAINNPLDTISEFLVKKSTLLNSANNRDKSFSELLINIRATIAKAGLSTAIEKLCLDLFPECSELERLALNKIMQLAISFEKTNSFSQIDNFFRQVSSSSLEVSGDSQIKLITIHKSKGLEFDLCVLANADFNLKPEDDPQLLIQEDPKTLLPLKVSLAANKELRANCAELSSMAGIALKRKFQETLNVIYVAVTRAKKDLFIFCPQAALLSSSPNAAILISKIIDPVKSEPVEVKVTQAEAGSPTLDQNRYINLNFQNILSSATKYKGLASQSATSKTTLSLNLEEKTEILQLGTIVHYLFSKIDWLETAPTISELKERLSDFGHSETLQEDAIRLFLNSLKLDCIKNVLDKSLWPDSSAITEKPFIYREGNCLREGRIDRLIVNISRVLIIDFKLGKKPESDSDKHNSYVQQLEVYKRGATILYPNRQIESRIIYLADGQVSAG